MRLYHQPRSRSTRVLWLAEEAGAPLDVIVIAREQKFTDDYKKLHPLSRSPAYVENGGPVFESAALCLHLADLHPEAHLIGPLGSHERALQYQWCFFAMTELEAPLVDIARELWKEEGEPDAARIDDRRARFENGVGVIESALAGGEYLVDDRFTVADIVVCGVLSFARTAEVADLPPAIVPYVDALEARPARKRAYSRTD